MKLLSSPQLPQSCKARDLFVSVPSPGLSTMHWRYSLQYRIELLAQSMDISPGESSGVTVGDYLGMTVESSGMTVGDYLRMSVERGSPFVWRERHGSIVRGIASQRWGTNHSHRLSHVKVTTPSSILFGLITVDNFPDAPPSSILQPQNKPLLGNFNRSRE